MSHRELLTESQRVSFHAPATDERGLAAQPVRRATIRSAMEEVAGNIDLLKNKGILIPGTHSTLTRAQR
jgi:hypothetical protein